VALVERLGRAVRFSPAGRGVRIWVEGSPGADETTVVTGTLREVRADGSAVVELDEPHDGLRRFHALPDERGWGLDALWFSFIAVNVAELDGVRWFIRLNRR
jgi:hypothetical protein